MTMRTTRKMITFDSPFSLSGVDRLLPAGDYQVVTDEEPIDGLSFLAYRRVSTMILLPAKRTSSIELVTVDPLDLEAAQGRDAATHVLTTDGAPASGR